ncbi:unnamed protein product [Caenorhabditis brenneri]
MRKTLVIFVFVLIIGVSTNSTPIEKYLFECYVDSDSDCSKSWMLKLPKEILRNELAREKACKNYFGKDACMEKEVTELCGEKLWLEFRDLLTDLSVIVFKDCREEEILVGLVKAAVSSSSYLFLILVFTLFITVVI